MEGSEICQALRSLLLWRYTVNCMYKFMPNLNPKTEQLSSFPLLGEAEGRLSRKQIQVKPEQEVYDFLMSLPVEERVSLMRKALRDAVKTYQSASSP